MLFAFLGMAQSAQAVCYVGGTLTSLSSGAPIAGVTFNLHNGSMIIDSTTTDSNGNYQLQARRSGQYYVFGDAANGLQYYTIQNNQYAGFYTFYCNWMGNFQADFIAVQQATPYAGQVYNSMNQGLANRTVRLYLGGGYYQDYITDSSGNFTTVNLNCYQNYTLEVLPNPGETITAVNSNGGGSQYQNISCSFAQNTGLDFLVQ